MLPSRGQIKGAHMSKSKNPKISGKNERYVVRSSAAEYLTFVAAGGGGSQCGNALRERKHLADPEDDGNPL